MNSLGVVPLPTASQNVPAEFKMAESWDVEKKLAVAMAVITVIARNNRRDLPAIQVDWQEVADVVNKAKGYGLTADAIGDHFMNVVYSGFLEEVGPELTGPPVIPPGPYLRPPHSNHWGWKSFMGSPQLRLLVYPYPQPLPQTRALTTKGIGKKGKDKSPTKTKAVQKRKAADEPGGSGAVVKKALRNDDGDDDGAVAAGGLESSRS